MSGENPNSKPASKRKQRESDLVDESATTNTEPKQKKQKQSKGKLEKEVGKGPELEENPQEESKEEKKARKAAKKANAQKKEETEESEPIAAVSTELQPETVVEQEAQASNDEPAETATSAAVPEKKKKERKRNKNKRRQDGADQEQTTATGNGTPEEDASLTEQAQKGIQYAWLYLHRHPKSLSEGAAKDDGTYWKFNKARQGWLWKNVWNEEIIPSKYVELVIGYLSSMQGQARQKLMDEAQKIVDSPVQKVEEPAEEKATTAEVEGEAKEEEAREESKPTATETETEAEVLAQPEGVSEEKHRRAQLVLDSLKI